jgi:hypothetical protein
LLEEIKHLFDVPGILFIFGMNGEQLGHSLSGAYGPNFDGRSYLRRFVNRQYSIKLPDLFPLISSLIKKTSIQDDKFYFPSTKKENSISPVLLPEILSKLMKSYRLGPRSAFHIVDMLKTCAALTGDIPLFGPYIILQILSRETGALNGELVRPTGPQPLFYINRTDNSEILDAWTVAKKAEELSHDTAENLNRNHARESEIGDFLYEAKKFNSPKNLFADPRRYRDLLDTVGRFDTGSKNI